MTRSLAAFLALAFVVAAPGAAAAAPLGNPTVPPVRDTEPVVLKGAQLGDWSVPSNLTVKIPLLDAPESAGCAADEKSCDQHNEYAKPEVDTAPYQPQGTTPVDRLAGFRYDADAKRYVAIPFQVDEMFVRYLDNSASGFAVYSGQDQHLSYAFDREGFRFHEQDPQNPCLSRPAGGRVTTNDPIAGLDHDDELAFMYSDAGTNLAPAGTPLPEGVTALRMLRVSDPYTAPHSRYVYVGRTSAPAQAPRSYVDYRRDANADLFEKSESSYDNYGNARRGIVCDADGNVVAQNERRRPRDTATVETSRYRYRYDGRWLMTDVRVSDDGGETYGRDLVDRWKARAFQQDPSSETPCCGYEEEDTNWGGSSTLLGEKVGPVRAIRETWGADSGTNVIRRETFYREEVRMKTFLRVHVIPPLDGIYAQWDFNAGVVDRYFSSSLTGEAEKGVAVDGVNDEVLGNLDDPCNRRYDGNSTSTNDQQIRSLYRQIPGLCNPFLGQTFPYHQSIDLPDPTRSEANGSQQWHVTTGDHGTFIDRTQIDDVTGQSAGGLAQSTLVTVPYYRDDACFDDGTGTDPGVKVRLRSANEPTTYTAADGTTQPRKCWAPSDGDAAGTGERFFQGSIGTHGIHLLLIADSDNARQTVPVSEIVGEQRIVLLPGRHGAEVGEQYGRGFEKPLVTGVAAP